MVRSIMGEGDSSGMIDISGLELAELLTADESSLNRALARILTSDHDDAYNSFQATI
jgi:FXSXX-COOH protein